MEAIWSAGLLALWIVVLVNLLLTLRMVRWFRALETTRQLYEEADDAEDLPVGEPAPDFRAKRITGEPVRLADFDGRETTFVFESPGCDICREKMPILVEQAAISRKRADTDVVLVSIEDTSGTRAWIETLRKEDGVEVDLPVLIAPFATSGFLKTYNPRKFLPYFCHVDREGIVRANGHLEELEWFGHHRERHHHKEPEEPPSEEAVPVDASAKGTPSAAEEVSEEVHAPPSRSLRDYW